MSVARSTRTTNGQRSQSSAQHSNHFETSLETPSPPSMALRVPSARCKQIVGMAAKPAVAAVIAACSMALLVSAEEIKESRSSSTSYVSGGKHLVKYTHTWPEMEFGWRIVAGTLMAFCGAAFGSAGGVGGGGVFVPMLALLIGFDSKSSAAISKCMIMGTVVSTVYSNIRLRHPTLDKPVIDYDLALLVTPMMLLGISIGVTFNVIFPEWLLTVLLIALCLAISIKAFFKGVETWKKETIQIEAARMCAVSEGNLCSESKPLLEGTTKKDAKKCAQVSIIDNVEWKNLGILLSAWFAIVALQIAKSNTSNCSTIFWVTNLLQIPMALTASGYQAFMLYKGKRVIGSRREDEERANGLTVRELVFYCVMGGVAGTNGGLLGISGGATLAPLFLELGVPPQVASATATFAVVFSSSMSVVEYFLLKRFPVPYTLYFVGVTIIAALVGQYMINRLIKILGRASLIIFILASTIFISSILIGIDGIANMINKIKHHEYMGFENLCSNHRSFGSI